MQKVQLLLFRETLRLHQDGGGWWKVKESTFKKGFYIYKCCKLDMLDISDILDIFLIFHMLNIGYLGIYVICTCQCQGWWEEVQQARCEKSRARKGKIGTAFGLGCPCNSAYVYFRCQKRFMYQLGNLGADALQEQGLQGLEGLQNLCPNIPWQLCHCRKKNPDWVKPAYVPTGNPRGRPKKDVGLAHPTSFERKL